jgi:hypothetical protein
LGRKGESQVSDEIPVVPLATSEKEAFEHFRELAFRDVRDIQGEYISAKGNMSMIC